MKGKLVLVPTPIAPELPLEQVASEMIRESIEKNPARTTIVVEEAKEGRRRWLKWGFPREWIEKFILYNEHQYNDEADKLIKLLQTGHTVYMMSDGGLPAFCDPGRKVVALCHKNKIKVTATPFPHSVTLALALSGLKHERFVFEGFLPTNKSEREERLKALVGERRTLILMDTPYRLNRLLEEVSTHFIERKCFLAMDLAAPEEELLLATSAHIPKLVPKQKREFILILGPI